MVVLEIACFNAEHAITAAHAGADRIELCDDREAGGTTPSAATLTAVKQQTKVPVYVMIRPRGGNFHFSTSEFHQMKADIDRFKPEVDGFVFGLLHHDKKVDVQRTAELVTRAHPRPCTFHRAFDETLDRLDALEDVMSTGCRAILSSGGAANAFAGANELAALLERAQGRIVVIPGGGVRARNIEKLQAITKATVYHSSALLNGRSDVQTSEIRQMKALLQSNIGRHLEVPTRQELRGYQAQIRRGSEGGEEEDVHASAVSIGGTTPSEEAEKFL